MYLRAILVAAFAHSLQTPPTAPRAVDRRALVAGGGAAAAAAAIAAAKQTRRGYINLTGFPFPLGPFVARKTVRSEIVPGRIWGFEQEQSLGGFGVAANARMVVVKLASGLWVHNPVAPTRELLDSLSELGAPVEHVVLGSTQYEHKVFAGPFARNFPKAKVHVAPDQWAFPLDLPPQTLGIFPSKDDGVLTDGRFFDDEFDVRVLRPDKRLGGGYAACEAAFVHRPTKTLILTDALIKVPKTPPPVLAGPALEALGRPDNYLVDVAARVNWRGQGAELRDATRRPAPADLAKTGWKRDALLSLFFGPSPESLANPDAAFDALAERWVVPPVCAGLVYDNGVVRPALARWVEAVAALDFKRAATSHFATGACSPRDWRDAYVAAGVVPPSRGGGKGVSPLDTPDGRLISDIAGTLKKVGVLAA